MLGLEVVGKRDPSTRDGRTDDSTRTNRQEEAGVPQEELTVVVTAVAATVLLLPPDCYFVSGTEPMYMRFCQGSMKTITIALRCVVGILVLQFRGQQSSRNNLRLFG